MNYYEHYLGDYSKKTAHLRMAGHGAYRLLLDHYYSTERALPAPHDALYVICRAMDKQEQAAVRIVADEFFPIGADGLRHNERADEEIARAQKRIRTARANGTHGGRPPKENPPGYSGETQTEPNGVPSGPPNGNPAGGNGEAFPHAPRARPFGEGGRELPTPEAGALPGTLTADTWRDWRAHLANRGKGMTPQQERLQLVRLQGHQDAEAVVQNAIAKGHLNLEPVGGWPDKGKGSSVHEKRAATAAAMRGEHEVSNAPHDITAESKRIA